MSYAPYIIAAYGITFGVMAAVFAAAFLAYRKRRAEYENMALPFGPSRKKGKKKAHEAR